MFYVFPCVEGLQTGQWYNIFANESYIVFDTDNNSKKIVKGSTIRTNIRKSRNTYYANTSSAYMFNYVDFNRVFVEVRCQAGVVSALGVNFEHLSYGKYRLLCINDYAIPILTVVGTDINVVYFGSRECCVHQLNENILSFMLDYISLNNNSLSFDLSYKVHDLERNSINNIYLGNVTISNGSCVLTNKGVSVRLVFQPKATCASLVLMGKDIL